MMNKKFNIVSSIKNSDIRSYEYNYLQLCENILNSGDRRRVRDHYCYSDFATSLVADFSSNDDGSINFPLITYRKVGIKNIAAELLWILRGDTDSRNLEKDGVYIWKENTTAEYLKMRNIDHIVSEKSLGPMYGFVLRCFNAVWYKDIDIKKCIKEKQGVDQIDKLIKRLKKNRYARNLLLTTYNPAQVDMGCLYPCTGIVIQFFVRDDSLHMSMYQRSADMLIGVPHNICLYGMFLFLIARVTGFKSGKLTVFLGDYHIYEEHIPALLERFTNEVKLYDSAKLFLDKNITDLKDIENLHYKDFRIENYHSNEALKFEMLK